MAVGPTKRRPSLVGEAKAERLRSTQRPAARPYSQRKRNYSKHLRLFWVLLLPSRPRSSFPPSRAHPGKEFFSLWQTRAESDRLRGEPPSSPPPLSSSVRRACGFGPRIALHLRRIRR